jgi:hypothetical protein
MERRTRIAEALRAAETTLRRGLERWRAGAPARRVKAELVRELARRQLRIVRGWIGLRRTELAYRLECRRARRSMRAVEKQSQRLVGEADARVRAATRPRRLARYGPFALFDDRIEGPEWELSLPSVRALVVPSEALTTWRAARGLPAAENEPAAGRSRLLVQGRKGMSSHACRPDDKRAADFARLLNVAALNAPRFERRRRIETEAAVEALEQVRAACASRISAARASLAAAERDTAGIDLARQTLERTRADTAEIDRLRRRLAELERAGSA